MSYLQFLAMLLPVGKGSLALNKWDITMSNGKTSHWIKNVCPKVILLRKISEQKNKNKSIIHLPTLLFLKKEKKGEGVCFLSILVSSLFSEVRPFPFPLPQKRQSWKKHKNPPWTVSIKSLKGEAKNINLIKVKYSRTI